MNKAVLVNPDIHKSPERRDIGYNARDNHVLHQVFDFMDIFVEGECLEPLSRVPARGCQFGKDVL